MGMAEPGVVDVVAEVELVFWRLRCGREWEVLQYGYKAVVL